MNNLFLNLLIKQRLRSILKKQWLLLLAFPCLVILFSLKMPASFGRTIVYMGLMLLFSLSCFIEKGFEAESTYFDGLISWHSNSLKHIFICNNFIYYFPAFIWEHSSLLHKVYYCHVPYSFISMPSYGRPHLLIFYFRVRAGTSCRFLNQLIIRNSLLLSV